MSSNTQRTNIFESPVTYIPAYKIVDLDKVTLLQNFDDDTTVKIEVPVFTGIEGLEIFHQVCTIFNNACDELQWTNGDERFTGFAKILRDIAHFEWISNVLPNYPHDPAHHRTIQQFNNAIIEMRTSFGGGPKARNHILAYIESRECLKKKRTTVHEHVRRIGQLITLANLSKGTKPRIGVTQANELIVQSMPKVWRTNWSNAGKDVATATTMDIIEYFAEQKFLHDAADSPSAPSYRRGKRSNRGQDNGQWKNNKKRKGNQQESTTSNQQQQQQGGLQPNDPCPLPRHKHTWNQCHQNPYGNDYRPMRAPNPSTTPNRNPNYHPNTNRNTNSQARGQPNASHFEQSSPPSTVTTGNGTVGNMSGSINTSHAYDVIGTFVSDESSTPSWNSMNNNPHQYNGA